MKYIERAGEWSFMDAYEQAEPGSVMNEAYIWWLDMDFPTSADYGLTDEQQAIISRHMVEMFVAGAASVLANNVRETEE